MVHAAARDLLGEALPSDLRGTLRAESRAILLFAEGSLQRLRVLSEALRAAAIPHAAYKGPALSLQAYGEVGARTFGDLDVFVPRRDLDRSVALLTDAGYTFAQWHDASERAAILEHSHHVAGSRPSPFADGHLEVHWRALALPTRPGAPLADALFEEATEEVETVPVVPWTAAFPVLVEHHAKHGWSRLLYVVDCTVRPSPLGCAPHVNDSLGRAVLLDAAELSGRLLSGTLLDASPELLRRTWHATDPYDSEVGQAYRDVVEPAGAWSRRAARYRAVASVGPMRERVYGVARQAFLEASIARGRVFGMRPNDASPRFKAVRAWLRGK